MEQRLTRKYGPVVAVCMVVGSMIGSGIFFRTEIILNNIGANLPLGILAWAIGGIITLTFAYNFANLANRYETSGGFVDYTEALIGEKASYYVGWFVATIYFPFSAAILAWVAARFTVELFGWHTGENAVSQFISGQTISIAAFYMIVLYVINMISPKIGGKIQVSTTVIKVIPLILMGTIGVIVGISNGTTAENMASAFQGTAAGNPFFGALVSTAFAFAGWETLTSLNSEVKNSKKVLPLAMIGGILIVVTLYILYFIGIFSAGNIAAWQATGGNALTFGAFENIFGSVGTSILISFIVVSCLGTTNAFMMISGKAFYSLAIRGQGPRPEMFGEVDRHTNMPLHGSNLALIFMGAWLVLWFGGQAGVGWFVMPWTLMIVPVTVNMVLIPIFIAIMIKCTDMHWFNRFVAPFLGLSGSVFMIVATFIDRGQAGQTSVIFWYLAFVGVILLIGAYFASANKSKAQISAKAVKN